MELSAVSLGLTQICVFATAHCLPTVALSALQDSVRVRLLYCRWVPYRAKKISGHDYNTGLVWQ